MLIQPFHLVLSALAHWANREQATIIDYLREENRVLRDRLGPKRLRFTGAERRRLAAKARLVCRSVLREIATLVVMMALENPSWGYTRFRGALSNIGHEVGRNTIARILQDNRIEPAPRRGMSWKTFLQSHWEVIAASDIVVSENSNRRFHAASR